MTRSDGVKVPRADGKGWAGHDATIPVAHLPGRSGQSGADAANGGKRDDGGECDNHPEERHEEDAGQHDDSLRGKVGSESEGTRHQIRRRAQKGRKLQEIVAFRARRPASGSEAPSLTRLKNGAGPRPPLPHASRRTNGAYCFDSAATIFASVTFPGDRDIPKGCTIKGVRVARYNIPLRAAATVTDININFSPAREV